MFNGCKSSSPGWKHEKIMAGKIIKLLLIWNPSTTTDVGNASTYIILRKEQLR